MASVLAEKNLMVNQRLTCHSGTMTTALWTLDVNIRPQPQGDLSLIYKLTGDLAKIRIPAPQPSIAKDGLWEHTCFEAFIAVEGEPGYHEFNFSPSGHWAAYSFSDYRVRSPWTASQRPAIRFVKSDGHLLLEAVIALGDLPQNMADKPLRLGLAAVIEASDGSRSYWALHHPEGRPDFHDRGGFILSLNQS
ncbi:MAG: DOMON-like domain-containing protein [Methylococcales bacterium]|nr:DOMON-like domain-containing protein [Methylococcales bacterium]MDD5632004.1 DOMON-like domain-containing protein [Methylococcales bacterium]